MSGFDINQVSISGNLTDNPDLRTFPSGNHVTNLRIANNTSRTSPSTTDYAVTRAWRLVGTMNDSDKSSLFGLSFAFLRRFAVIDVGLPDRPDYQQLVEDRLPAVLLALRAQLLDAAMRVAHGPIRLGPAILLDIAEFTRRGVTKTAQGVPYADPVDVFLTAVRLYAVPPVRRRH